MTESSKRIFFTFVFALVFYDAGTYFVESFANYPTWKLIGAAEFKTYHNALSPLIIKVLVLPWLIEIILTFFLFWLRLRAISIQAVVFVQCLNFIGVISSVFIQIPIQMQLDENGFSLDAINKLLATDPIRCVPLIVKTLFYLWMMSQVVCATDFASERDG